MVPSQQHLLLSGLLVLLTGGIGYGITSSKYRRPQAWLLPAVCVALLVGVLLTVADSRTFLPVSAAGAGTVLLASTYAGKRQLERVQNMVAQDGKVNIHD